MSAVRTIRIGLGQVSQQTTRLFVDSDLKMKAEATARCEATLLRSGNPDKTPMRPLGGTFPRTSLRAVFRLLALPKIFGMGNTSITTELAGLRVTIDKLVYRRLPVGSAERPHSFVYFVSIHNDTDVAITIKGRKWVVTHSDGQVLVVEGDGVVGQQPTIPPSGKFSYNSQHLISTAHATAEGAYLGLDENGRRIVARIPKFQMVVPG